MARPKAHRPKTLQAFQSQFPKVWAEYRALRDACDQGGPLNPTTRELIKIGVEVARKRHGGLVAHIRRAQQAGASNEAIYHAILLAIPLVGIPDVLDAFLVAKRCLGAVPT